VVNNRLIPQLLQRPTLQYHLLRTKSRVRKRPLGLNLILLNLLLNYLLLNRFVLQKKSNPRQRLTDLPFYPFYSVMSETDTLQPLYPRPFAYLFIVSPLVSKTHVYRIAASRVLNMNYFVKGHLKLAVRVNIRSY
jgi:hypothetical protein